MSALKNLEQMVYPGRVIIMGKGPGGEDVVMYAITGRSPSSQARRLVAEDNKKIFVKPTDEQTLKTGNPDLLIYPSVIIDHGIAVSNGKQTSDISPLFKNSTLATIVLVNALYNWDYEPDEPNYTPRISGCVYNGAVLSIIKRADDGSSLRNYFQVPEIPGKGKMIATYTGVNENPLPSFSGEPLDVGLPFAAADEAAAAMYEALGPAKGADDYRVAAAAVYCDSGGKISIAVKNRHDL